MILDKNREENRTDWFFDIKTSKDFVCCLAFRYTTLKKEGKESSTDDGNDGKIKQIPCHKRKEKRAWKKYLGSKTKRNLCRKGSERVTDRFFGEIVKINSLPPKTERCSTSMREEKIVLCKQRREESGWEARMFVINALKYHRERERMKLCFLGESTRWFSFLLTRICQWILLNYERTQANRHFDRLKFEPTGDILSVVRSIALIYSSKQKSRTQHTCARDCRSREREQLTIAQLCIYNIILLALEMRRKHMLQIMMSARGMRRKAEIFMRILRMAMTNESQQIHEKYQ